MKKILVLVALFAMPILAYLFFASGRHNFKKLPILSAEVGSLDAFHTAEGGSVSLQDSITVMAFYGHNPEAYMGNAYVLAEKIYDNFLKYKDFQLLVLVPEGTRRQTSTLEAELVKIVDPLKWKFAYGSPEAVRDVFRSLDTNLNLQEDLSTPFVFIFDKEGKLRGRTDDEDTPDGRKYGYDTRSVAELDDKMTDDVNVLLAEYRLALKGNELDKIDLDISK